MSGGLVIWVAAWVVHATLRMLLPVRSILGAKESFNLRLTDEALALQTSAIALRMQHLYGVTIVRGETLTWRK